MISQFLSERGFSINENIILRHNVGTNKKRRAFVNDLPCSLDTVRELGDLMLDLNGQFEEQGLLNVKTHRDLVDMFGNLQERVKRVESSWAEMGNLTKLLDTEYKKKLIWFHAASIGEVQSILPLIFKLNKKRKLELWKFIISS